MGVGGRIMLILEHQDLAQVIEMSLRGAELGSGRSGRLADDL
jgi:hypothetical protein